MINYLPSYEDCIQMCSREDAAFYESKFMIDGFNISVFNYRLARWEDFINPIESRPNVRAHEMRGLTFVFNSDGTLFKRFLLLEKFFNLNQVPDSMYSVVKNYKIKYVNNKEDGSIASFIKLPNGKIIGKTKMGFDNDQAKGINKIYKTRSDIKRFVDWCLDENIIPIFEYVSPSNRIVLKYSEEDLILLRMRDNNTGIHLDLNNYIDEIGTIRISPFESNIMGLDSLIESNENQIDKEGVVVQSEDEFGRNFFFKIKTPWYVSLHGLLTTDIYRENILIKYILNENIDDILGQIPETEIETRERINKIISIIKKSLDEKVHEINESYQKFLKIGSKKEFALKYSKVDPNFGYVMLMSTGANPYDLAKNWLEDKTKRLQMAREFLKNSEPSLFFKDVEDVF